MEAFYWQPPSPEVLARNPHLKATDFPEPHVEVWDENWDVFWLFRQYHTQWRMGPCGPIGLDFGVIHHALDRKGIKGEEFDQYVADMRTIEVAALRAIKSD